jgi:uncharacterized hydrophobic protein (TIGR00271 family)
MTYADFRVLATAGKEEHLWPVLSLACALARAHGGAVTLLHVTTGGDQPEWLRVPEQYGDVFIRTVVREGASVDRVILEAARVLRPDLLVMGWRGAPGRRSYLLGSTLDPVTRYAPCDVAVVREGTIGEVRRVLVPVGAGPNSPLALELALSLGENVKVTALNVVRESLGPTAEAAGYENLGAVIASLGGGERIEAKVVRASGVIDGILSEAAAGYDMVMIGASNESYIDRKLFGNVPQTVAADAPVPTVVVRHRVGPVRMLLRRAGQRLLSVGGNLTTDQQVEAYRQIRRGARANADFFTLISIAAAIATLGLLMDSPAVIIGAMVIAPLMSAILGISLGVVQGDPLLLWSAGKATLQGAGLAILIGALVSAVAPGKVLTAEILARTRPTLFDLGVALLSGLAGAYAQCRRAALSALSGVAIAVALVPPLATIGIGATMLDRPVAFGATLLFLTNLSAIVSASSLLFLFFGFRPDPGKRFRVFGRSMLGVILLLVAVSVTLSVLTVSSLRSAWLRREIDVVLEAETRAIPGVELDTWDMLTGEGSTLQLEVRVKAMGQVSHQQIVGLQKRVAERLGRPVALALSVIPVTQLDPVAP